MEPQQDALQFIGKMGQCQKIQWTRIMISKLSTTADQTIFHQ